MNAGYSETPLSKKLGLKANMRVSLINPIPNYWQVIGDCPEVSEVLMGQSKVDFVHGFFVSLTELEIVLPQIRPYLESQGMIWLSWLKKKQGAAPSELNRESLRAAGLQHQLVDVKVCAFDHQWSALKFVIPRALR